MIAIEYEKTNCRFLYRCSIYLIALYKGLKN